MKTEYQILEIARRIRAYQQSRHWSDAATLRRLPTLGSTKTYKRILDGHFAELDLDSVDTRLRKR